MAKLYALKKEERVEADIASKAIDDIINVSRSMSTSRIYKLIASKIGVHPVTLLRYHKGELHTIPSKTLDNLLHFRARVIKRHHNFDPSSNSGGNSRSSRRNRVPAKKVKALMDKLMGAMGLTERQLLYRVISERTGIHNTTLLRYYRGNLASAPQSVLDCLKSLMNECSNEKVLTFKRSDNGKDVIPRLSYKTKMDELFQIGGYTNKAEMFREVARDLDIDAEKLRKAYYDKRIILVPFIYLQSIEKKLDLMKYEPSKVFQLGDRVNHPLFGPGVVDEKKPHHSIGLRLKDGRHVLLREAYRHDPYWEKYQTERDPDEWAGDEDVV
ncbi:MAG: hypothetical protein GXP49_13185 [Deltaproteobacteria bacterium]|nr:hypothetical protein [Deltaproteobacteria bacterium]